MKHFILFCLFVFGLSPLNPAISAVDAAEEDVDPSPMYQSFFGKDSTVWYYVGHPAIDAQLYRAVLKGVNSEEFNLAYMNVGNENYLGFFKDPIISSDNSKVWIEQNGETYLVVDMNLGIGDSLFLPQIGKNIGVNKVFWENDIKHIQFDLKIYIKDDIEVEIYPYEIMEGIGSLYPSACILEHGYWYNNFYCPLPYEDGILYHNRYSLTGGGTGVLLRSVYKDGKVVYVHPILKDRYDEFFWTTLDNSAAIESNSTDLLSISCQNNEILIKDPGSAHLGEDIIFSDKDGRVCLRGRLDSDTWRISLDGYHPGLYIIKVGTHYSTKIWVR